MKFKLPAIALISALLAGLAQAETINVNGVDRSYVIDLAPGSEPKPVIIALHGGGGTAEQFRRETGLSAIANDAGVTVVYPESITRQWNDGRAKPWNRTRYNTDDIGFLQALVQDLAKRGIADPNRVTFTGVSNGGMMSFAMACTTNLPIFAIAPVSSNVDKGQNCTRSHAALLNIVGTADRIVPMRGGKVMFGFGQGEVNSSTSSFAMFLRGHRCSKTTTHALPNTAGDGMTSTVTFGRSCISGPVAQIVVNGGGHGWPGLQSKLPKKLVGAQTMDFSASTLVVQLALGKYAP